MSKLHKHSPDGFTPISKEDLTAYNTWRANRFAERQQGKIFWALMCGIGLFGGAILEIAFPTTDAICAKVGFVMMLVSACMKWIVSIDRD